MTEEQTLVIETGENLCIHSQLDMIFSPPNGRWICVFCGEVYAIDFSTEVVE